MDNRRFWSVFSRRALVCFTVMLLFFLSCILRVAVTATSNYGEIRQNRNSYKIDIARLRGTIFDCNMIPLTNSKKKIIAAVSPTNKAIMALKSALTADDFKKYYDDLSKGKPVVCEVNEEIKCDGIETVKIYENSNSETPSIHIVGYTDSSGKGVSGIEEAYDDLLYSNEKVTVYFESDGKGGVLKGAQPLIENNTSVIASGVVTTLDINIQSIVQKEAKNIECGAIVIAEAETGKIRASVSMPNFNCENIENYLNDKNSPLLNRAINAYNVGSVFKPCVASSGLENEISNFYYFCSGKSKIVDRYFKCHKADGHKFMTLKTALANSCNTYFYNYAQKIGYEKIYNMASSLNFGNSFPICDGIYNSSGSLPQKSELSNPAALANFCIGQGKLLLSPVSMLTLYCSIATDGSYYLPSIVEKTVKNGKFIPYDIGEKTRVMKKETSQLLRSYLSSVLTDGTGLEAKPETVTAAGKTATAQTGKYENGVEISQGWFCGFFPLEKPKYVAIIFSENITKQTKSCNKIFASLADEITALKS